jgi:hypothetical protein
LRKVDYILIMSAQHAVQLKHNNLEFYLLFVIFLLMINDHTKALVIDESLLPESFINKVYSPSVHTVILQSATWELSVPLIEAGSSQMLELHFDVLSTYSQNFGYTLIHCDANWKKSNLSEQEYLSGFGNGLIKHAAHSFNTTCNYIHYTLTFPEEECKPIISGNYAIVVFDEDDPDKLVLVRRFYVTEKNVQIEGRIKQPAPGISRETGQQVEITVLYDQVLVRDPAKELTTVVIKNNRYDLAQILDNPFSMQPGRMDFSDPDRYIFPGGNEFRSLDIKSMKYQTENIASIEFQKPGYHVYLKPDEERDDKPYFSKPDLNGNYFIDSEKSDNKHTESDYVYVHFSFIPPPFFTGEEIYVTGGFCDWTMDDNNKMTYNAVKNVYELTFLLKQGLYDYCYAIKDPVSRQVNETILEGSYFETRNDYSVFVYFHDSKKRCDRLVGYMNFKR